MLSSSERGGKLAAASELDASLVERKCDLLMSVQWKGNGSASTALLSASSAGCSEWQRCGRRC